MVDPTPEVDGREGKGGIFISGMGTMVFKFDPPNMRSLGMKGILPPAGIGALILVVMVFALASCIGFPLAPRRFFGGRRVTAFDFFLLTLDFFAFAFFRLLLADRSDRSDRDPSSSSSSSS